MKTLSLESVSTTTARDIQLICLEASVLSNMTNTIRNIFPDFLQKLTTSFAQIESIPEVSIKLPQLQQFVVKHLDEKQYLDLADLTISIPEGFKGNLLEYADVLNEIVKEHSTITETVLKPFTAYLSHFISNKDAKLSVGDTTDKYIVSKKVREHNIEKIAHYRTDGHNTKAKLGETLSRKADIQAVYVKTVLLTQTLEKINLKYIQDQVKHCVELLSIIVDQVESGKILNVTPEVTKNLAFSALQIAEEIEFMAIVYFKALGFTTCVDSMSVTISNYIKEIH